MKSFSYYVAYWWAACEEFVIEERKQLKEDPASPEYYIEFQKMAQRINERDMRDFGGSIDQVKPNPDEVQRFLEGEAALMPEGRSA